MAGGTGENLSLSLPLYPHEFSFIHLSPPPFIYRMNSIKYLLLSSPLHPELIRNSYNTQNILSTEPTDRAAHIGGPLSADSALTMLHVSRSEIEARTKSVLEFEHQSCFSVGVFERSKIQKIQKLKPKSGSMSLCSKLQSRKKYHTLSLLLF